VEVAYCTSVAIIPAELNSFMVYFYYYIFKYYFVQILAHNIKL